MSKNDTTVSFGYRPAGTSHFSGGEIARRGYATEVSVLSPAVEPAEPLAKVLAIHRDEPKPVPVPLWSQREDGAARESAERRRRLEVGGVPEPVPRSRKRLA